MESSDQNKEVANGERMALNEKHQNGAYNNRETQSKNDIAWLKERVPAARSAKFNICIRAF